MASNNYSAFPYGSAQYNAAGGPSSGYNAPGQVAYPAVTNATFANAAAYQTAAVAAGQPGYASAGAGNAPGYAGYGDYGRALQSYDATKTFYQQASTGYNATQNAGKTHYSAPPVKNPTVNKTLVVAKDKPANAIKATVAGASGNVAVTATTTAAAAAAGAPGYSNYDAALYTASMYMAQQQQGGSVTTVGGKPNGNSATTWTAHYHGGKGGAAGAGNNSSRRPKQPPRPQQLHYCDVCKISCAGPQTYREHLEGQKHKKREASLKLQASAQTAATNRGNNYHCELCDVTCTGTDAYAAHVRGAKHQKVVKLHQKLGKPIPSDEPKKMSKINFVPASTAGTGSATAAVTAAAAKVGEATESQAAAAPAVEAAESADDNVAADANDNIKPVGGEYIEEIKDDEGKILSFNCKLCDCKFNDPNAKEMHMKGRRHRLQYKRKVQPDLVVEFKPRQSRLAGARAQRALMQAHRNANASYGDEHDGGNGMYWDEQRRRGQYEDEYDYSNWMARSFGGQHAFGGRMGGGNGPPPFFGMMPSGANVRRPESNDDRHAIARHAEIYPQEDELQTIQRIVSHTERALKFVSDTFADNLNNHNNDNGPAVKKEKLDNGNGGASKDGRENQMISFHKEADTTGCVRILKGVMRVGYLAKGLLLQGDVNVELVVLCAEKPTVGLLKRVAALLPVKLKEVAGESSPVKYEVETEIEQSAVIVRDEFVTVKISLTSPLLREASSNSDGGNANAEDGKADGDETANDNALLPKGPCLKALAELRHAKWFQARATSLQSCVMVIRILRDLCQRLPAWGALSQWALELLVEKVISSAGFPISPGDCLRRIMEALACGFLINGPGLLDPCEKEPTDALANVTKQQREDLTVSAQKFLRFIAFRQIYKVLDMDQLPAMKFPMRPWRLNRKRRRSSGKGGAGDGGDTMDGEESASDEKIAKIDCSMDTDAAPASSAVVA